LATVVSPQINTWRVEERIPYKLDEDDAFVLVPAEVVDADEGGTEEVPLVVAEPVSVALVSVVELPDFGVVDAADTPGVAVLDAALLDVWAVVVDVPVCAGVDAALAQHSLRSTTVLGFA